MGKTHSGGVVIGTGFKLPDPQPIADYMVVDFHADLADLDNQFEGMTVYVKETQTLWYLSAVGWKETGKTSIISIDEDTILNEAHKWSMIRVTDDIMVTIPQGLSPSFITDIDAESTYSLVTAPGVTATGNVDAVPLPYRIPKNGQITVYSSGANKVRIKGDIL